MIQVKIKLEISQKVKMFKFSRVNYEIFLKIFKSKFLLYFHFLKTDKIENITDDTHENDANNNADNESIYKSVSAK